MKTPKNSDAVMLVERRSLADQAADLLRQGIFNGAFQAGERLTEVDLAQKMKLSRGTIRAALRELTHEGLVQAFPYTGWAVARMTVEDAEQLYVVRGALEALAARLAAENMTPEGAARLEASFSGLVQAVRRRNRRRCVESDLALHKTIFELTGNAQLLYLYEQIEQRIRLFVALSDLNSDLSELVAWHQPLVSSIREGDSAAAEKIAHENASRNGRALVEQLRKTNLTAGATASVPSGKVAGNAE